MPAILVSAPLRAVRGSGPRRPAASDGRVPSEARPGDHPAYAS
ncbi:hypothetical protein ACFOLD_09590 [Kocuria carniphila]